MLLINKNLSLIFQLNAKVNSVWKKIIGILQLCINNNRERHFGSLPLEIKFNCHMFIWLLFDQQKRKQKAENHFVKDVNNQ